MPREQSAAALAAGRRAAEMLPCPVPGEAALGVAFATAGTSSPASRRSGGTPGEDTMSIY